MVQEGVECLRHVSDYLSVDKGACRAAETHHTHSSLAIRRPAVSAYTLQSKIPAATTKVSA